ncbi:MAG: CusA/CzcA family heavy metal efflux RND transporter [Verrucomicrobiales bacterium]|nr:CusA/CzcA family heavy metal efflux RND transporter [Verrucomicrobiales bacterium]
MNALIRISLRNRVLVLAAAMALTAYGIWVGRNLPVDVFPDLSAPTVTVVTEAHGMTPIDLEQQVTFRIETALNGAFGVRRIRSATAVGISLVWVEFDWDTDIRTARQIVSEKLDLVAGEMPEEVERPIIAPNSSIMGDVMFIALTSDRNSLIDVRNHAELVVRRRLLAVSGVSQVSAIGGGVKQYQVVASPESLAAYDVTLDELSEALRAANRNVSAGVINQSVSEWLVSIEGRIQDTNDIASIVIRSERGTPVTVGQVAQVRIGTAPMRGMAAANGSPAVVLGIRKQSQANTLELTRRLEAVLDDLEATIPPGMTLHRDIFRQADFIRVAVSNVVTALRDGVLLVVIVILLFLANFRSTVITLTAIPLSLITAVLSLQWLDATINTMTLGGMAIAIGALVDDAIIDVENVFRRLRENWQLPEEKRVPALRVVFTASAEIRSSITFATIIIVLVFTPVFFLDGVEGRLLAPLGMAYVVSLLASLVVAMTVTPVLCYFLLPESRTIVREKEPTLTVICKSVYGRVLPFLLNHTWVATIPTLVLFGAAVFQMTLFGRAFLPQFNEGSLTIGAVTIPGTSLVESDKLASRLDRILLRQPEVVAFSRQTGRAEQDEHVMGVEASEFEVQIDLKDRTKAEFLAALREEFDGVPGMNIEIGQPISHRIDHMLSGTRAAVAVKIFGPDIYELRSLGERARSAMENIPGVADLSLEQQRDVPTLRIRFRRDALARHGLTIDRVASHINAAVQGEKVSEVLEGRNAFDLVVRIDRPESWTLESLGELLISTPSGARVPLGAVAQVERFTGPNRISREQVERKIVVSCNVAGRDVMSVVNDCREKIEPMINAQTGYRVQFGGQFESAAAATQVITFVGVLVVIGIALLLYMAFSSARDATLVMLNLPLALIGGVAGVYFSGGVLSVASLIGFITVFGIAVRNGIMLVSHIRHLQLSEGVREFREAVYRGAMERLVPILMTGLATSLALIPLVLGAGEPGKEIETPMAIVILCGLTTSMLLNMAIVPTLYLRFGRPVEPEPVSE